MCSLVTTHTHAFPLGGDQYEWHRMSRMTGSDCAVLGVSQYDTIESPLWRETLEGSLGSHGAAERVGVMCHGSGCRLETT